MSELWLALLLFVAVILLVLVSLRRIPTGERGRVVRLGKVQERVVGPGIVFAFPLFDKIERISVEPFSVSLPPQSAITKDESPLQLQASINAKVLDPNLAVVRVKDWRVFLISQLQDILKTRLEDVDLKQFSANFESWVQTIQSEMKEKAASIGVEITSLQISNLTF